MVVVYKLTHTFMVGTEKLQTIDILLIFVYRWILCCIPDSFHSNSFFVSICFLHTEVILIMQINSLDLFVHYIFFKVSQSQWIIRLAKSPLTVKGRKKETISNSCNGTNLRTLSKRFFQRVYYINSKTFSLFYICWSSKELYFFKTN
jgi:hypothetical protein